MHWIISILSYTSQTSPLTYPQGANVISTPMFVGGDFGLLSDAQQLEGDTMTALTKEIERQLLLQKRDKTVQPPKKNINMMPTRAKL